MNTRSAQQGIAITVVLLFTALILSVVLTTVSISAIGAKAGSGLERRAYRSLLAADSGLSTFSARVKNAHYMYDTKKFPCWVQGSQPTELTKVSTDASTAYDCTGVTQASGLTSLQVDGTSTGPTATLSIVAYNAQTAIVTVRSSGAVSGATRVTLQDFRISKGSPVTIRVPGAITSYPEIKASGDVSIQGLGGASSSGVVTGVTTTTAAASVPLSLVNPATFTVNIGSSSLLTVGGYVQMNVSGANTYPSNTYRVSAISGNTVTFQSVGPVTTARSIPSGTSVDVVLNAPTAGQTLVAGSDGSYAVKVVDKNAFLVNDKIYIGPNSTCTTTTCVAGTVTSISSVDNTVYVKPDTSYTRTVVGEGEPIRKDIFGAVSAYSITVSNNSTITPNSCANCTDRVQYSTLFQQTFNMTKDQMLGTSTTPGMVSPITWDQLKMPLSGGITYVKAGSAGNYTLSGNNQLCGSGILIFEGNLVVNGTCTAGFTGLIYVIGDYDQQGNSNLIKGAVVAEGRSEFQDTSSQLGDTSQVAGTGKGSNKIQYDPLAILQMGKYLADFSVTPVTGTWRQQ